MKIIYMLKEIDIIPNLKEPIISWSGCMHIWIKWGIIYKAI